jgi:hypothetical protein
MGYWFLCARSFVLKDRAEAGKQHGHRDGQGHYSEALRASPVPSPDKDAMRVRGHLRCIELAAHMKRFMLQGGYHTPTPSPNHPKLHDASDPLFIIGQTWVR